MATSKVSLEYEGHKVRIADSKVDISMVNINEVKIIWSVQSQIVTNSWDVRFIFIGLMFNALLGQVKCYSQNEHTVIK